MRPKPFLLGQGPDTVFHTEEAVPDRASRAAFRHPGTTAVVGTDATLTYGELDRAAKAVACRLMEGGVNPGDVVGLAASRSYRAPSLILGIMRSGAIYLPLDPLYPEMMLASMTATAGVRTIIVDQGGAGRQPAGSGYSLDAAALLSSQPTSTPLRPIDMSSAAYAMYTSGTTGTPKGVLLGHAGLSENAWALSRRLGLRSDDRCLGIAPLGFSSSIRQLLLPLAYGATTVIPSDTQIRTPWEFAGLIETARVTQLDVTPSFWRALLGALTEVDARRMLTGVRRVLFASEPLDAGLTFLTLRLAPHVQVWNMYGCTETTGIVTAYAVNGREQEDAAVPIGTALEHVKISLLPPSLALTESEAGQIIVTGRAITIGHLDREGITESGRLIRRLATGDRATNSREGFVWQGRLDRVVKVRGMRIASEAVEQQLVAHEQVRRAAVIAATDRGLVCAVEPTPGTKEPDPRDLIAWLRSRLPVHMVPIEINLTTCWPQLPNGKTDFLRLRQRRSGRI